MTTRTARASLGMTPPGATRPAPSSPGKRCYTTRWDVTELAALETRRSEIEAQLQAVPPPLPRLHPNLPELYRRKVEDLQEALREPETTTQAALALRGLIDRVRLVPVNGALEIELEGARAALLALGVPESKHPRSGEGSGVRETLVAGAGFEPATFRL